MYALEVIFLLIQKMTKSEKRYFKLVADFQKGAKGYALLYNLLASRLVFNQSMQEEIMQHFPGSTLEPARKHLYKVLMKCLRQFESIDVEVKLMNLLQDSRILYNKGMITFSLDQLEKGKLMALQHEKFIFYTLMARQELEYLARQQFVGVNEYELVEKQKKISLMLAQEANVNKHAMLHKILILRYLKNGIVRSPKDITQLNDLLLEEYQLLNNPGYKSFAADQLHLHFQSIYFQMTGNPQGSLDVFLDLNKLFQNHTHLWKDSPQYYLALLDGILYDLRWMGKYKEMDIFIASLKALALKVDGKDLAIKYSILKHDLNRNVDMGLYQDGLGLLQENLPSLQKEGDQLPFDLHGLLMVAVCRIYISVANYSAALKIINDSLNQPVNAVNQSLYIKFQLLNLLVKSLMKDTEYIRYAIRSIERKLKFERKLFETEKLILSALKKWLAYKPVNDIDKQLDDLSANPFEHQLIKELCLKLWITEMKFKKKPERKFAK